MKNAILILVLGMVLSACSSIPKLKDFNKIESGMSRKQVEKILGEPKTTMMKDGKQILVYDAADGDETKVRWVAFTDGEVSFYGKPSEYVASQGQDGRSSASVVVSPTISPTISPVFNIGTSGASNGASQQPTTYLMQPVPNQSREQGMIWNHSNPGN